MLNDFSVIGDLHLTPKSLEKGVKLFKKVEEIGLPTIWLGDLLDTKEVIRGKCLNLLYEYFKSSKLQHIIIVGNHDWFNLECLDHALKVLSTLPNVRVIDEAVEHPTLPFVFFPYIHDKAKLKELVAKFSNPNKIAIGHFDVSGFDYGNGHICEDGLRHEDFLGYKRVISGHFHKLQQTGNFTYLGTPFSHSFGEANQDKVIGIYHLDKDDLEMFQTEFPRHVSLKVDVSKRGAEKKMADFIQENKTNLIRIQLYGPSEEVIKIDKSKYPEVYKWEDKSEVHMEAVDLDENMNNKTQFTSWAQDIKGLDKETLTLGLEILEAVGAK